MSAFFFCLVGALVFIGIALLLVLLVLMVVLASVARRVERLEEAKGLISRAEENKRRAL